MGEDTCIRAGLDPALCQSCLLGKERQGREAGSCVGS